jgi:hypothetical protein
MSLDIRHILDGWPYEPGQVTVRRIRGDNGEVLIQLRLDLGLLQMASTGRPDGQRPHGCESLLHHYQHKLQTHTEQAGGAEGFGLDERACELLRAEGVMYYHRYLAEFILEDYEAVYRDTQRNLQLMDFCATYAKELSDRYILEQYRPYVLMMCTRAQAQMELSRGHPKVARAVVQEGIGKIEAFYRRFDQAELAEDSSEIALLRSLAKEIEGKIPVDPIVKLKRSLDKAIAEERYEEAAVLRDKLQRATQLSPPKTTPRALYRPREPKPPGDLTGPGHP